MNKDLRPLLLVLIAIATTFLTTCSLAPVSITDRINMFISSLNGDRSKTWENLDPNLPNPSSFDANYWGTYFAVADEPFVFASTNGTSNALDVEGNISGTTYGPILHKFIMVNIGTGSDDWRIHALQYYSLATFTDYPGL
jgi:hypothetical protein